MVIYADVLFLINLAVNYLALLGTAKVCGKQTRRMKILAGAAIGAIYAVVSVLNGLQFLVHPLFKISVGILMSMCAFMGCKSLFKITAVFFVISALFGGVVFAVSVFFEAPFGNAFYTPVTLKILVPSFAVTYAVISIVFKRMAVRNRSIVEAEVRMDKRRVTLLALEDSGNQLIDPVSGKTVMIAELEKILPLFEENTQTLLKQSGNVSETFVKLSDKGNRFRLIPFRTVGISEGLLLAFMPDGISVLSLIHI